MQVHGRLVVVRVWQHKEAQAKLDVRILRQYCFLTLQFIANKKVQQKQVTKTFSEDIYEFQNSVKMKMSSWLKLRYMIG